MESTSFLTAQLKRSAELRRLSLGKFAELAGIGRKTAWRWFTGKQADSKMVEQVCRRLNWPEIYLPHRQGLPDITLIIEQGVEEYNKAKLGNQLEIPTHFLNFCSSLANFLTSNCYLFNFNFVSNGTCDFRISVRDKEATLYIVAEPEGLKFVLGYGDNLAWDGLVKKIDVVKFSRAFIAVLKQKYRSCPTNNNS